nr:MAG TPA: hypothetical protein [Caudoviricetes sp.]
MWTLGLGSRSILAALAYVGHRRWLWSSELDLTWSDKAPGSVKGPGGTRQKPLVL